MNLNQNNLRLVSRNEGKIKSYESCSDIRAWSHDLRVQDRYLREWMKADMPICILPTSTLTGFIQTMTCRSRRRATPRCNPDCKSRVLLEMIRNSCQAMKKCLQQNEDLEKYFVEEELESSHWPCDKCLEALKSIKMFWKILIDKLFGINLSKFNAFESNSEPLDTDSVRSIAKIWQTEILQQALYVNNITPPPSKGSDKLRRNKNSLSELPESSQKPLKSCRFEDNDTRKSLPNSRSNTVQPRLYMKASRNTSVSFKMADVGCDTCFIEVENEKDEDYKNNIKILQAKCESQSEEIENFKKENTSLRIELENVYKRSPWKAFYTPNDEDVDHRTVTLVPQPFEPNIDEPCPPKNVDSEMIITMKNCKNESFRHVSLLQVLHKTNDPILQDINEHRASSKKEDPMEILNKVQNTFGAFVRREMSIINDRRHRPKRTEVNATFHRINTSRSAPSCSASSTLLSSEFDFDFGERT